MSKVSDHFLIGWKRKRDDEFARVNAIIGDRNIVSEVDKPHRTYGAYPNDIPGGRIAFNYQRIFFDGPPVERTVVRGWREYVIEGNEVSYKH